MKRGLKGFAFLVSGLVLGIGDCDRTERCGHGKGAPCQQVK